MWVAVLTVLLLAGMFLQGGWSMVQIGFSTAVFHYDPAEVPKAKPWTAKNFKNNPDNFQFAILGDRGGGASPLGTYERAIEQLNWLQPEFVMSVGDYVEGYATVQEEMAKQWEEFGAVIAETVANLDIATSAPLLLIGHSKGTTDILHFLVNFPDLARKVTAVLSVAGAVNGSVIADKYAKTYHKWFKDLSLGQCRPGDGGVLDSLTRGVQFEWLISNPLPETLQYYSIATFARKKNIQAALRITYKLIEPIDPLNDGQLMICDQLIPGSTLMAYVNADHWTVAVPVEETFSGRDPDTLARNKKLRTILFEAMILFMVEDLQQNLG